MSKKNKKDKKVGHEVDWTWTSKVMDLLQQSGISQRKFSFASGIPQATLSRWMSNVPACKGKGPTEEQKKVICDLLMTPYENIFLGLNPYASLRYVPVIDLSIVKTVTAINEQIEQLQMASKVIACPFTTSNKSFAIKLDHDGFNAPIQDNHAIIPAGSILFFDPEAPLKSGLPSVFCVEGSLIIRSWQHIDDKHWLSIPNPKYSNLSTTVDAPDKLCIASLVAWSSRP